ncbi:MAG TPA: STAS domain-containing protein [Phycisphaerae bacterium]|nr:STAS domain-containing protein [Phycisphaerae bacterium]
MFSKTHMRRASLGTAEHMSDGRVFYRLTAMMKMSAVPDLRQEIFEVVEYFKPLKFILELDRLHRFGGAGLAILVEIMQRMPEGGRIYLVHAHTMVRGMIEIGQLQSLFTIVDDMPHNEAVDLLNGTTCLLEAPYVDKILSGPPIDIHGALEDGHA